MDSVFQGAMSWLRPMADTGIGDYVFFKLINDYLNHEIDQFGMQLLKNAMDWVTVAAMVLVTLWVMVVGYRLATGQSRESAMAVMGKATKIVFILMIATSLGANGAPLHKTLTQNLDKELHQLFTDEDDTTSADAIDKNLALTQIALAAVDIVRIDPNDPESLEQKRSAMLMAGVGASSPAMAAGAMLLLFKFTMAFLIGVGPLFVLALMFDSTKDLFKKWLFYVIGTLFSMSMLSVVSAIVLKLSYKVAAALWVAKGINSLMGNDVEGLSSQAMQQGGIGLLLTTVIITMPTVAAALWQGSMGSFMAFSAFDRPTASSAAQGQAGGGYIPQQAANNNSRLEVGRIDSTDATSQRVSGAQPTVQQQAPGSRGMASPQSNNNII
ncbi:type IV secretion system protein [Xanthomonas axonopodis pv. ricini]|uniref:type IV secretion system protein n=1 Tax=Xanthomonas euvesicatoria TaxID=456327 RepID=UPI002455E64F|nr:type IV secretion system protein [Xanthomonas euvesicatoria]MDH4909764.1 type IV secretion system protein [Xanthomonas euvesicatoria]